jgi:undecaprenyl-diphosphatase
VSAVAFSVFGALAGLYADSPAVAAFDTTVTAAIQSARGPVLDQVMKAVTVLGSTVVVATATIVLVLWLWRALRRRDAVYSASVMVACGLMITVLKERFERVRPPADGALVSLPSSYSFPSGHSMGSLCLAWVFGRLAWTSGLSRSWKAALLASCLLYPVLVGVSRIYLGVHWPSDVLASWALGIGVIGLAEGTERASRPVR